MKINLKKLTVCAVLIALSTVLSLVKVYQLPLGGSITLFSMLPICLISVMYGVGYALLPCLLYSFVQILLDLSGILSWGLTPAILIGTFVLDYILAYGSLFIAGILRKKGALGITLGISLALVCRFISHFLSGIILFKSFDIFNNPTLYSIIYNGSYMLPEIFLTVIGAYILFKTKAIAKIINLTQL